MRVMADALIPSLPSEPVVPSRPIVLDYAPAARSRGRRLRRRLMLLAGVLLLAGVGILYGPRLWKHGKILWLQEQCLRAELPGDRVVEEWDRERAKALAAAHPGEYFVDPWGGAYRIEARWERLAGEMGLPANDAGGSNFPAAAFLHERFTPSGQRRLIVANWWRATVIEPAGVFHGARLIREEGVDWDPESPRVFDAAEFANFQVGAGSADPSDRSRWVIPWISLGVVMKWEYQLHDDDTVTMRLLDPQGTLARVEEARRKRGKQ